MQLFITQLLNESGFPIDPAKGSPVTLQPSCEPVAKHPNLGHMTTRILQWSFYVKNGRKSLLSVTSRLRMVTKRMVLNQGAPNLATLRLVDFNSQNSPASFAKFEVLCSKSRTMCTV
uniref:Uncharacterized protein n=1 Tax=Micrurus corallinus TaxID=54390 RepID=A0A2D4FXV5_MICCO